MRVLDRRSGSAQGGGAPNASPCAAAARWRSRCPVFTPFWIQASVRLARDKCVMSAEAPRLVAVWRAAGERVVLASGVFDLLHVGHVRHLEAARRQGDRLIVAVNGDVVAARLKGPGRPVLPAIERATLVAALRCVDAVFVFEEPTADRVLTALRPDVHATGTDVRDDTVPERAAAAAGGVKTVITGDPTQQSSRELVERVRLRLTGGA